MTKKFKVKMKVKFFIAYITKAPGWLEV